ncbi:stage III sporulation protein AF [Anoxybacteroides tepidamans]|uniref:stage III sporulation protein AF n=1 Tax=Anoxybacteroides tepidamans TaxID=265948 RepID=UPI0004893D71|nr:stage III sporulation protein AF [Anoxybacillus tepidamans]
MNAIMEWVTNIIMFILFAIIIDLLLPSSSFQKYIKMAVGLILLLIMLSPLLRIFSIDADRLIAAVKEGQYGQAETVKNEIEKKKKEIQASQRAYILEQMAVQMKKQVAEELMKQYGLEVENIAFRTKENESLPTPDDIQAVKVTVRKAGEKEAIQPVVIDTIKPLNESLEDEKQKKELASFFSAKWGVQEEKIDVQIEGREWGDVSVH